MTLAVRIAVGIVILLPNVTAAQAATWSIAPTNCGARRDSSWMRSGAAAGERRIISSS
jgi:hypothetical protein